MGICEVLGLLNIGFDVLLFIFRSGLIGFCYIIFILSSVFV